MYFDLQMVRFLHYLLFMRRILLIAVLVLLGNTALSPAASANEVQMDALPASDQRSQVRQWFEGMGIDTTTDGFAKDMYNLMTGIDQRLSPTANFTVSAGNGLRMGFSWK